MRPFEIILVPIVAGRIQTVQNGQSLYHHRRRRWKDCYWVPNHWFWNKETMHQKRLVHARAMATGKGHLCRAPRQVYVFENQCHLLYPPSFTKGVQIDDARKIGEWLKIQNDVKMGTKSNNIPTLSIQSKRQQQREESSFLLSETRETMICPVITRGFQKTASKILTLFVHPFVAIWTVKLPYYYYSKMRWLRSGPVPYLIEDSTILESSPYLQLILH